MTLTMADSLNDSGIGVDADSPISAHSTINTATVTAANHDMPKYSNCDLTNGSCGPTFLDPRNTIQQAFIMATSDLGNLDNDLENFRGRASSSSSEDSIDVEKTFDLGTRLDHPGPKVECIIPANCVSHVDTQIMPIDSMIFSGSIAIWPHQAYENSNPIIHEDGSHVQGRDQGQGHDLIWSSMPKDSTSVCPKTASPFQHVFYQGNQVSQCGGLISENVRFKQPCPVTQGYPMYIKASSAGGTAQQSQPCLVNSEASGIPYNCNLPNQQPIRSWNTRRQQKEQQLDHCFLKSGLPTIAQLRLRELWEFHERRLDMAYVNVCSANQGIVPVLCRLFDDQYSIVMDLLCSLLDEMTGYIPAPKQEQMPPEMPPPNLGTPSPPFASSNHNVNHPILLPNPSTITNSSKLHVSTQEKNDPAKGQPPGQLQMHPPNKVNFYPQYSGFHDYQYPHNSHMQISPNYVSGQCQQMAGAASTPLMQYYPNNSHNASIKRSPNTLSILSNRKLKSEAIELMNMWFRNHLGHPYPSPEVSERIANACNITVGQVKKWFANKRMRTRNTKSLHDIALARRQKHDVPLK